MRKRRESDQKKPKEMKIPSRKTCFIVLFLLVLCSWMIPSIAVYGFDVSGMDAITQEVICGYMDEEADS